MNPETRREYRTYAFDYFNTHADQRLRIFNFYITFSTIIIGGFVTLIAREGISRDYWILPVVLIFFSFIFWKFEERVRMLGKNGEDALKYLDTLALNEDEAKYLALFDRDDQATKTLRKYPLLSGYFSYSRVFRWVYGFFAIVGAIGFIACIFST